MDARQFLAEFGHIANAPGGVAKLREMVLQLALTGNLVEQRLEDSNVDDALAKLRQQRQALLVEQGVPPTRKHKNLEAPNGWFPIPNSWRWESFGYLSLWPLKDGDWIESKDQDPRGDVRIVQLADVGLGTFRNRSQRYLTSNKATDLGCYFLRKDDVLIARLPDPLGRACIFPGDDKPSVTVVDVAVCRCSSEIIQPKFLMNCINAPSVRKLIESWAVGTTRQRVATGRLGAIPLPVAPIEEQSRIVAKVDELMALCDKLEAQQQARRKLQNTLRLSTLQTVAAASSTHELQVAWSRLSDNFGRLFHAPEDVTALKLLILKLAMRGLLVGQVQTDTPATVLLQEIAEERQRLTAAKKLKGSIGIPPLKQDELPYQLPRGWIWARVIDLVEVGTGATPAKSEPNYYGGSIPWYTSSATNEKFACAPETFITEKAISETNCKVFPAGSLIVALYGQGKTRGQISEMMFAGATNQAIAAMIFLDSSRKVKRYLKYYFEKIYDEIRLQAEGGPQPNLNVGKIKETLVPIPPIEEQSRIVTRLDELFRQCDRFSSQLRSSAYVAKQLAHASTASLTGISTEQNEEQPAPLTEMEAIA